MKMVLFMRNLVLVLAGALVPAQLPAGSLPLPDANFPEPDMAEVKVGQLLFYDPILSGNREVACATCHHPKFATSDGLALGIGDGGIGLGTDRIVDPENPPEQRIPRNSPALFNLGATEFVHMFNDGRLEADPSRASGIRTPLEDEMVAGFDGILSAQTMFPVLSPDEMAGHYSENEIAQAVRLGFLTGEGGAWDLISKRVEALPEYRAAFDEIIGADQPIRFTDISNALAEFIAFEWRADNSPFDRYLRDGTALPAPAAAGMALFYGPAGCSDCHAGQFQTDHDFHALAMPQIGPGKAERFERHQRDTGRMRVTGAVEDAFKFRTPSLRNVTLTEPYGHAGTFGTLEAIIRHHLDPVSSLKAFDAAAVYLPELATKPDLTVMQDAVQVEEIAATAEVAPISLSDAEIADLVAFLGALEDREGLDQRLGVPESVPSGLKVPN